MSHHIYSTDAIIINIFPDDEESVIVECLTADLGRIYVHIQGAKKIHNKHRMHVIQFGMVTIDCVLGKQYYRCTGIAERVSVVKNIRHLTLYRRKMIIATFGMIQRLVPSGIPIPEVFAACDRFFMHIIQDGISDQDAQILAFVVQLRVLGILGYWNSDWTDEVIQLYGKTFEYVSKNSRSVQKLIEKILVETHMYNQIYAKII